MTLNLLDENGVIIDSSNPLVIEHNGTTGDEVTLKLSLVNSSDSHYYKNIGLLVNEVKPVSAGMYIQGEKVPYFLKEKYVKQLDPLQEVVLFLKTVVPKGVSERVVTGIFIYITSMRYPLS